MNILPFRHEDEGVHAAVGANPGAAAVGSNSGNAAVVMVVRRV
jgi:hypothetical protein